MQENGSEGPKWEVRVDALPGEYVVETFSEDYAAHIKSKEVGEPEGFLSFIAMLIGGVICLVGFLTLIFGPSQVMVSVFRGPTFFQFIQLNPGPIFSLGAIIIGVSNWVLKPGTILTPEAFFLHYYTVVCPDGTELNEKIVADHIEKNTFRISNKVSAAETTAAG